MKKRHGNCESSEPRAVVRSATSKTNKTSNPSYGITGRLIVSQSTLAAAMAQQLRKRYYGPDDAIASIYIAPDMKWDEAALEAVLQAILVQITKTSDKSSEAELLPRHAETSKSDDATQPRIEVIRTALKAGIRSLGRTFLVMEGVDDCGWFAECSIEKDLVQLQQVGLKVFLSSRTLALTDDELS
jgi:hypothetical protein